MDATAPELSGGSGRRAQYAVCWTFLVSGLMLSSWFVRVPGLAQELRLSTGQLGIASFAVALGGIVSMQFTGRLTSRFGSRPVLRTATFGTPFLLLPPALARDTASLLPALVLLGLGIGVLDVAMNAHGGTAERVLARPVMNSLHASWSIGGISGSALAALAAGTGLTLAEHFLLLALTLTAGSAAVTGALLPAIADRRSGPDGSQDGGQDGQARPHRPRWSWPVVRYGLVVACCMLAEGSMVNWSALFMTQERAVPPGVAALAYLMFSIAMAGGRVVGNRLAGRWPPARLLRTGSAVAVAGLASALVLPSAPASIAAFGICGLGLSVVVPTIFSAAGRASTRYDPSGAGVGFFMARVSTLGYLGVLGGPVLIGAVAQRTGLTAALAVPALLIGLVGFGAHLVVGTRPGAGHPPAADHTPRRRQQQ